MKLAVAVFVLAVSVAVHASGAPSADSAFAAGATEGGLTNIQTARLALQKSRDPRVRGFAEQMLRDTAPANRELAEIVASMHITLPAGVGQQGTAQLASLERVDGAAFTSTYLSGQADAHRRMAQLVRSEIAQGKNLRLVAFARRLLPDVQQHLQIAESSAPGSR